MKIEYSGFAKDLRMTGSLSSMPIGDRVSMVTDQIRDILQDPNVKAETKQYLKEYMADAIDKL